MGVLKRVMAFWTKFGNDWGMNLAGLLAYNFLTAIFPLLLGILALVALVLPDSVIQQLASKLSAAIPSAVATQNKIDFYQILLNFRKASGVTAIVSLVGLLWTGSNLFGVMENCFSIVFRTRDRDFIWQKLMALVMIVLFAILAPLAVLATSISGAFGSVTKLLGDVPGLGLLVSAGSLLAGVLIAFVLFFLIYMIVPNMDVEPRHAWRGALFSAVLFEVVSLAFPIYVQLFGSKGQFGSFVLLLGLLTFWFWVVSLILILGAEMNSFAALGQRAMGADLASTIHAVQVHGRAPREAEDADAPPVGHPVSKRGEAIHAEERDARGATTKEGTAHPPGDREEAHRGASGDTARGRSGERAPRPSRAGAAPASRRRESTGSRMGWPLVALLAVASAVLSSVGKSKRRRAA